MYSQANYLFLFLVKQVGVHINCQLYQCACGICEVIKEEAGVGEDTEMEEKKETA